jgi:hypothetical protein
MKDATLILGIYFAYTIVKAVRKNKMPVRRLPKRHRYMGEGIDRFIEHRPYLSVVLLTAVLMLETYWLVVVLW